MVPASAPQGPAKLPAQPHSQTAISATSACTSSAPMG